MPLDNSYANRVEGLFYSKSDEKFTVRALLEEILGTRRFDQALDVGPGPGHISEPLARRSRNLVMVEKSAQFEEVLKRNFDNATIIMESMEDTRLKQKFNLILCSHVLYYMPESRWMPFLSGLVGQLNKDGELILIMNSDAGDWWKIVNSYWDRYRQKIPFHYIPVSQLKKDLAAQYKTEVHPYRYQVWIEPGATWFDFVGRQLLELSDEVLLKELEPDFEQMGKRFKQVDGSFVLDFWGDLIRVHAKV